MGERPKETTIHGCGMIFLCHNLLKLAPPYYPPCKSGAIFSFSLPDQKQLLISKTPFLPHPILLPCLGKSLGHNNPLAPRKTPWPRKGCVEKEYYSHECSYSGTPLYMWQTRPHVAPRQAKAHARNCVRVPALWPGRAPRVYRSMH